MEIISYVILHIMLCFLPGEETAAEVNCDNVDLLAVLKEFSHALQSIGDILKDSVQLHRESLKNQKESKDALTALEEFPDLMVQFKRQLSDQNESIILLKKELTAMHKAEEIYEENNDLKSKLENETSKVVELESRLNQSQSREDELSVKGKFLNETNETPETNVEESCSLAGEENIRKQVQEYNRTKDWGSLQKVLKEELSNDSTAYKQLQHVEYNDTLMHLIGWRGLTELMEVLVNCGGAINFADSYGFRMLHGAAGRGNLRTVQWLLLHGANTECRAWEGLTPLIYAAGFGNLDMVKYLVQAGASTTARTTDGRTAWQLARSRGHTAAVEYLSQLPH